MAAAAAGGAGRSEIAMRPMSLAALAASASISMETGALSAPRRAVVRSAPRSTSAKRHGGADDGGGAATHGTPETGRSSRRRRRYRLPSPCAAARAYPSRGTYTALRPASRVARIIGSDRGPASTASARAASVAAPMRVTRNCLAGGMSGFALRASPDSLAPRPPTRGCGAAITLSAGARGAAATRPAAYQDHVGNFRTRKSPASTNCARAGRALAGRDAARARSARTAVPPQQQWCRP